MNNKELLRRKLEYATPEELLFILLNDTDNKFKKVIKLWKEDNVEGTILAGRLSDNVLELRLTLNTEVGNEQTREALRNISSLYDFIIDEITLASVHKDFKRLEEVHSIFSNIKNIFDEDRKNLKL